MTQGIGTKYRDPLRRLTPTALVADLGIMGRRVRLESNSHTIVEAMRNLFNCCRERSSARPDFVWRLVGENNLEVPPNWPEMAAFSDRGLRYINFGKNYFLAVDLDSAMAVAFIPEELANDPAGFSSVFAATLFDMTASALGLVQISAACVSLHGRAVLVIGPARSGKTTSTYVAGTLGLEFHSDQASYLDLQAGGLRVWGQFWPAAFREESLEYLPELASATRSFSYGNLTYKCYSSHGSRESQARAVTPVACVFLEREAAEVPQLIPLSPAERETRMGECFAFREDLRFQIQRTKALYELGSLPAYRLPYGSDPAVAALFLRSILRIHNSMEISR